MYAATRLGTLRGSFASLRTQGHDVSPKLVTGLDESLKFVHRTGLSDKTVAVQLVDCSDEFRVIRARRHYNRNVPELRRRLNNSQDVQPGNPGLRQVQENQIWYPNVTVFTGPAHITERIFSVFDAVQPAVYSSGFECLYRQQGISRITLDHEDLDLSA